MPQFFTTLLHRLRVRDGDIQSLCRQLISQRGEVTQTALAQRIIELYRTMDSHQRLDFFNMLVGEFGSDQLAIQQTFEQHWHNPTPSSATALFKVIEPPRQELFRRMNTGHRGTETLVAMRGDLLRVLSDQPQLDVIDADLKHLFRSWFNRGFLRLERIGWHTSALILEKLIEREAVHEINGWPDLRRRLAPDRRCFAFFHAALPDEPIIFIEVALTRGLAQKLAPLLEISSPIQCTDDADTAIFYSINNCLHGLRGIPFGNFLIKQVVDELGAELPKIKRFSTLSPMPYFAQALRDHRRFARERLGRLLDDFSADLKSESGCSEPVEALFQLLHDDPTKHIEALSGPLRRLALVYLTFRIEDKLFDPVAAFHFSNGARLESINPFANLKPYGLKESFGMMVNYGYRSHQVEENHEQFVRSGEIRLSGHLRSERELAAQLWEGDAPRRTKKHAQSR
jgi:malonyl-CoA decarboxylase